MTNESSSGPPVTTALSDFERGEQMPMFIQNDAAQLRFPGVLDTDPVAMFTDTCNDQERLTRRAEKIAEQAELLDLAHDCILVKDMKGTILFWNRGAADMYGWTRSEAEGRRASELLQSVYPASTKEIEAKLLEEGHWEGELVHTTRHGGQIVVASRWALKRNKAGEPQCILQINSDITSRKVAEERVQSLNQHLMKRSAELERLNRELECFSYSVAHDLRAPLRHIDGFVQLLVEEVGPQLTLDAQHYVAVIQKSTRRMGRLIDDLLNLGLVSQKELQTQVTSLERLVDDVVKELSAENLQRSITWNVHSLPIVQCDPGLMKQVFRNLLSNAVKFTAPRERAIIEVTSLDGASTPTIVVRDNGIGFSMKYIDKLFGIFQRMDTAEEFEGTGVGLATVRAIVERHGGRIWAEAEECKGATFYFTVARRTEECDRANRPAPGGEN